MSNVTPSTFAITGLRPVFIVGNPRSGTTLVQQIVSAHADFWTVPETFYFHEILKDIKDWRTRPLRPDDLPAMFKRAQERGNVSLTDADRARIRAEAEAGTLNAARLLVLIMEAGRPADTTAQRWIEKTPRHVFNIADIWSLFPDAQMINVLRDPRSAISSPKRFFQHPPSPKRANAVINLCHRWNRSVAAYESFQDDPRIINVQYEHIIRDPERELNRIAEHIGTEPDVSALSRFSQQINAVTQRKGEWHKELNSAEKLVDRREVWKQRLSEQEVRIVETLCEAAMLRYGYQLEQPPQPDLPARMQAQHRRRRSLKRIGRHLPSGLQQAGRRFMRSIRRRQGSS